MGGLSEQRRYAFKLMDESDNHYNHSDYLRSYTDNEYRNSVIEKEIKVINSRPLIVNTLKVIRFIVAVVITIISIWAGFHALVSVFGGSSPAMILVMLFGVPTLPYVIKETFPILSGFERYHYNERFYYEDAEKYVKSEIASISLDIQGLEKNYGPFEPQSKPYETIKSIRTGLQQVKEDDAPGLSEQMVRELRGKLLTLGETLEFVQRKIGNLTPLHEAMFEERKTTPQPVIEDTFSALDEHNRVIEEYLFMEMSPSTIIEAPALLDVTVPEVEAFHKQRDIADIEKARDSKSEKFRIEVKKLAELWDKAQDKAYDIGLNGLNGAEKRRARSLLESVIHAVNKNEAELAKRNLMSLIDKINYETEPGTTRYVSINKSEILDKVFTPEITA